MSVHSRTPRRFLATAAVCVASLAVALLAGVAIARSFVLQVASGAKVTNQSGATVTEAIGVNSHGRAVYTLSGDTRSHPRCTKAAGCWSVWPPVTVAAGKKPSKQSGLKGKLGTWKHSGLTQVTLGGHPLYTFAGDTKRHDATGEGLQSFGGTWHVVKADPSRHGGGVRSSTSSTSSSTTSSSSTCYLGYCY
jgi:predicted lipoprotein with Yx(FWY)xxD motif